MGPGTRPHAAGPHSSTGTFVQEVSGVNLVTAFLETSHLPMGNYEKYLHLFRSHFIKISTD